MSLCPFWHASYSGVLWHLSDAHNFISLPNCLSIEGRNQLSLVSVKKEGKETKYNKFFLLVIVAFTLIPLFTHTPRHHIWRACQGEAKKIRKKKGLKFEISVNFF